MRNVLIVQLIIVPLAAAATIAWGPEQALAALYGGAIALGNTLLSMRRIKKADRRPDLDPVADVRSLYAGAVERLAFTLAAMAAGMGWLRLVPPALLFGFALAHLAYPLAKNVSSMGQNRPGT